MNLPVRAIYKRAPRGCDEGWEPQMQSAVYADVPDEVVRGVLGQCARIGAQAAHDDEAVEIIDRAIDKACAAGAVITMR